jgi:hypothetical protein
MRDGQSKFVHLDDNNLSIKVYILGWYVSNVAGFATTDFDIENIPFHQEKNDDNSLFFQNPKAFLAGNNSRLGDRCHACNPSADQRSLCRHIPA